MTVLRLIGSIVHIILKIVLLPVQIILTMLICMIDFAGGVFGFIFGIVGGFIIIAGFSCLFMPPVDWKLFTEAMVIGTLIGSFPRMVRYFGESLLIGMKDLLARI
ncbi:MAG: hypothetical protein J6I76_00770 [Oribacterium sp.]|nr:hypothetical protein [Oribacterium sp.]MBP3802422.1 hypothetical protein [Oribacterium sp.]